MAVTNEKKVVTRGSYDNETHMFQVAYQGRCLAVAISSGSSVTASALTASCNMIYIATDGDVWVNTTGASAGALANTNGTNSFFMPENSAMYMGVTGGKFVAVRATSVANVSIMEAARG